MEHSYLYQTCDCVRGFKSFKTLIPWTSLFDISAKPKQEGGKLLMHIWVKVGSHLQGVSFKLNCLYFYFYFRLDSLLRFFYKTLELDWLLDRDFCCWNFKAPCQVDLFFIVSLLKPKSCSLKCFK